MFKLLLLAMLNFSIGCVDVCINNNSTEFRGYDVMDLTWGQRHFGQRVWVQLLTRDDQPEQNNCNYGYYNVNSGNTTVLCSEVDNTGMYTWHVPNLDFHSVPYYIQISSVAALSCDIPTINEPYVITEPFNLEANNNNSFIWGWPRSINNETLSISLGNRYFVRGNGFHHRDRVAFRLRVMASLSNFEDDITSWNQVDAHPINMGMVNISVFPNWLGWKASLQGASTIDNREAAHSINVSWQLPADPTAYIKQGGSRYTLARDNGTPILLTDNDVALHIVANIYTYERDASGNIIGVIENCFDHDNDNDCELHETSAYRSENFRILISPPSLAPSLAPSRSQLERSTSFIPENYWWAFALIIIPVILLTTIYCKKYNRKTKHINDRAFQNELYQNIERIDTIVNPTYVNNEYYRTIEGTFRINDGVYNTLDRNSDS